MQTYRGEGLNKFGFAYCGISMHRIGLHVLDFFFLPSNYASYSNRAKINRASLSVDS